MSTRTDLGTFFKCESFQLAMPDSYFHDEAYESTLKSEMASMACQGKLAAERRF